MEGYFFLGCDIGGAKELGVIYFPTNWGAKESQNLPNHRVVYKVGPGSSYKWGEITPISMGPITSFTHLFERPFIGLISPHL